jgi:hypothetical protein
MLSKIIILIYQYKKILIKLVHTSLVYKHIKIYHRKLAIKTKYHIKILACTKYISKLV